MSVNKIKIDLEKIKEKKTTKELLEFGIINVDKPSGPTSFDVSEFVMKALGLRKTSHFGTLDPKVTGVLPVALNRACKLTGFFLGEDKEYVGIMRIHKDISLEELKKAIKEKFLGKITQLPPVKSRVARVFREREIKKFEILEKDGQNYLFHVECQGGTYIRKLVDDLGKELGVGAHMLELRRMRAGIFKEEKSYTLYEIEEAAKDEKKLREMIIPGEIVSELYPVVQIKKDEMEKILRGQPIYQENLTEKSNFNKGTKISVFCGDKFIGVYVITLEGRVFAKPEFVLQPIGK
ncbi:MAG: RNA-guided pseudouridylation complex pseudouridine synthase subunit Cbf5 [Candidatus Pacearchaeota archaeon]|jgi:H/ACA ribonucleoprotein complex subunit 4